LIVIPLYFFNLIGIILGSIFGSLLLLYQAKKLELLPSSVERIHKKIINNEEANKEEEKKFYNFLRIRVDERMEKSFDSVCSEVSEVIKNMLEIIKKKKVKARIISCLNKEDLKKELGKNIESEELKRSIIEAIEKGYLEIYVLGRDEQHFVLIDGRDIMIQEKHPHGDPKDMIYREDCVLLNKKYNQKFYKLLSQATKLGEEEIKESLAI
jgi:hypothetical protein